MARARNVGFGGKQKRRIEYSARGTMTKLAVARGIDNCTSREMYINTGCPNRKIRAGLQQGKEAAAGDTEKQSQQQKGCVIHAHAKEKEKEEQNGGGGGRK
jgi:hypothetical protein